MKKYLSFFILIAVFANSFAQEQILNGGFESGVLNWGGWWSRDGKAGATVVTSDVHSGSKALKINYIGAQDWSFPVSKQYSVTTGDIVTLSVWVNAESLGSNSEFSVELMDSKGVVTTWVYEACPFTTTSGQFQQFKKSFIVPSNVSKIIPRFEGYGPNNLIVDDVSMSITSSQTSSDNYHILENDSMKVVIAFPSMKINAVNKLNSKTYTSGKLFGYSVNSVDSSLNDQIIISTTQLIDSFNLDFKFSLKENVLDVSLSGDSASVIENDISFPSAFESNSDDYLVIPRGTGLLWPVNKNYFSSSFTFYDWKSTMSFIGVTNLSSGYMIVTDDPWDTEAALEKSGTALLFTPAIIHHSSKGLWAYNRNLHYVFVNNGYNEMCQWYRKYADSKGYLKTLAQKEVENPNIEKLKGAVDFWVINMGLTQNDPKNFLKYGIDKALFSLNGYETNLPKLIDTLNSKGYLSSKYDIFTDVWPPDLFPAETGYRRAGYPEDVIIKKDGNYQEGWMAYVNGSPFQGYVICSETHSDFANTTLPADLSLNHYNTRFIDVEMATPLKECYSDVHPVSRKTDAIARIDALNTVKNTYSLVTGVEEARDFSFPVSDYGEGTMTIYIADNAGYDWSTPVENIGSYYSQNNLNPAERIPLHGLVYHDVHIPSWYTGDGVSKVPAYWDDKDLFNILYASMPLFMPPNRTYWNTNLEKFLSSYHLTSSINRKVGFDQMLQHSFLSADRKLQQTSFSNGWEITVNFDTSPRDFGNIKLSAKGFYASDGGGDEVFRIIEPVSGTPLAAAVSADRLFINPYGTEKSYKGVKTTGSIFMQNKNDGIHLAFIGSEKFIYLKPDELPWKLGHAFSETTGKAITMTSAGNGWLLLNRPAGESFVRFDLDSVALAIPEVMNSTKSFECYPNPANEKIEINIFLKDTQTVQLSVMNLLGQPVMELMNKRLNRGFSNLQFDVRDLSKGTYFFVMNYKGEQVTRKVVIL